MRELNHDRDIRTSPLGESDRDLVVEGFGILLDDGTMIPHTLESAQSMGIRRVSASLNRETGKWEKC